jgi:CMP-2-keto-3-deoxyoctulosonic acid synthetase
VTKSEKYKILGCNIDIHKATSAQNQTKDNIMLDKNKRARWFSSQRLPMNWESFRNTLLKAAVPMFIIVLVIGAYLFKRVRTARKETLSLSSYSEVKK